MAVLLVTYDLNKETSRPNIVGAIRNYGGYARLSESSYAIDTEQTPDQVFNSLKKFIDSDDQLYVITLKQPYAGYGPKEVNDWLDNNLTY